MKEPPAPGFAATSRLLDPIQEAQLACRSIVDCLSHSGVTWVPRMAPPESPPGVPGEASRPRQFSGAGGGASGLVLLRFCPGEEELRAGTPFADSEAEVLNKIITALGLSLEQVYQTYFFKSGMPLHIEQDIGLWDQAREALDRELSPLDPLLLVPFSARLVRYLAGLPPSGDIDYEREYFFNKTLRIIPAANPSVFKHEPLLKKQFWQALKNSRSRLRV